VKYYGITNYLPNPTDRSPSTALLESSSSARQLSVNSSIRIHSIPIIGGSTSAQLRASLPDEITRKTTADYGVPPLLIGRRLVIGDTEFFEEDGLVGGLLSIGVSGDPVDTPEGFVGSLAP